MAIVRSASVDAASDSVGSPAMPARRSPWPVRHGPALAGYLALTAVFFWPAVWHFRTRFFADEADGAAYIWNLWSIPRALLAGENPFSTELLFHPVGALTAFNTNVPLLAVVSWPLQAVFGLTVATNLVQFAAVVLSGFGAYLLALHVCGDRRAAFVAGAAFAFIPYRVAHAGHFSLTHLEFLPFGLLTLLLLYERPTRGRAAAFGLAGGLAFLTDLYITVFLLLAAAVVAAWKWRRTLSREMALRFAQAGGVALAVASPLVVSMLRELIVFDSLDPLTGWANADNYSADLLSWIVPASSQRIWGDWFVHLNQTVTGGERLAFPGFVVLALAAVAVLTGAVRRHGVWLVLAGTFVVLSLGPFLHVNGMRGGLFETFGQRYAVPLPYFALRFIPVLNGVRVPGRFSVVAILALDVLAALALARLARTRPRLAWAAPAVALVLVVAEFLPKTVPTFPDSVPAAYDAIARDDGDGAVLEIPLQWRTGFGAYGDTAGDHTIFLYYATRHGQPLVSGMVARYPEARLGDVMSRPVNAQIVELQRGAPATRATFTADDLAEAGIGYVVYHRDRPRPEAESYIRSLGLPPLADDGTVVVWKVPKPS